MGDILDGRYLVERILGVGGMGVVVAARHLKLDERVAIKLLLPDAIDDTEAIVRFEREARASVKIKNEHIARVTDVATLESGVPYMVMEYLEGEDLATCLGREGPLSIEDAVDFALQACEALAEAHNLGVIHRDLKPANLFCVRRADGRTSVKLLDFGISKMPSLRASGPGMNITTRRTIIGTPVYMSPEQLESASSVDQRSDVWGIGVVLYELLSGNVPFSGANFAELSIGIVKNPPPPLRDSRPDVPAALDSTIRKCLEKDRANRFANIADLALALAPFGPERGRRSLDEIARISGYDLHPLPKTERPSKSSVPPILSWWKTGRTDRRPWNRATLAAGSALTAVGFIVVIWATRDSSSNTTTRAAAAQVGVAGHSARSTPSPAVSSPARPYLVPSALPVDPDPVAGAPVHARGTGAKCTLNLNSIPVANVAVDGQPLGVTPKVGFSTAAGSHTITFDHPLRESVEKTIVCQPGETKAVGVRLERSLEMIDGIEKNPYR